MAAAQYLRALRSFYGACYLIYRSVVTFLSMLHFMLAYYVIQCMEEELCIPVTLLPPSYSSSCSPTTLCLLLMRPVAVAHSWKTNAPSLVLRTLSAVRCLRFFAHHSLALCIRPFVKLNECSCASFFPQLQSKISSLS